MDDVFLSPYNPNESEDEIYKNWKKNGFFNPDICVEKKVIEKDAETFSMVLPPPNVTGTLHMGSAFMLAIEDTIVRYNRMKGKRTLWIPGTDHAAIATQSKVEKIIQKEEGKNRHDLGREELLKRIEKFAKESHDSIVNQIEKMGCSLDWSREAFTLDEKRSTAVKTAFKKMYDDGIIYRGYKVINWDPKGQTTISDDEIVYEERESVLYTFRYSKDFPIAISTTRLETKVGDTGVAVHPDDNRYKEFIGKIFNIDFAGEKLEIKIVSDTNVDPNFGTGALGVTPAHSIVDYEIAQKNNLPIKQVINEYAKMINVSALLEGKKTTEAREIVANWLRDEGLMLNEEKISQNLSTAERTGGIIEPLPKMQWFINVNKEFEYPFDTLPNVKKGEKATLKKLMLSVVENKDIDILPERFERVYVNWIENLRDWCISRQIWYGHRIPVWYKGGEIYCDVKEPEGEGWDQDSDTLDTWFSSGLWTFSTLGWPEETSDFKTYHPTTVLETGYDIIFFWVARMILMSTYLVGQIPFSTVYLHGLVRDNQGRKISKSLGNNIDPIDVIQKYGADAVRMALLVGTGPGNDSKISDEKFKAYKHFANKIWNIARFILSETHTENDVQTQLTEQDKELIVEFDNFTKEITTDIDKYNLHIGAEKIYHYMWHRLADIIIEESKPILKQENSIDKNSRQYTLRYIFKNCLVILHPFMPFITEKIWSHVGGNSGELIVNKWPI